MSLISGIFGLGSAEIAGNDQIQAAQIAANTQLHMYDQTRADLLPYMTGGNTAFSQLGKLFTGGPGGTPNTAAMTTALTNTPGYQFGLSQGQQSLDRSAASQGLLLSGAQQKASQEFGTNYAIQQAWSPYVSELNSMAGMGESAAAGVGAQGTSAAASAGAAQLAGGNAASNQALAMGGYGSQIGSSLYSYLSGGGQGGMDSGTSPIDLGGYLSGLGGP